MDRFRADLKDALSAALQAIIDIASTHGIGPHLPKTEFFAYWFVPTGNSGYSGKKEKRFKQSFSTILRDYLGDIEKHPKTESLNFLIRDFLENSAKHPPFFNIESSHAVQSLYAEYFRRTNLLEINKKEIDLICEDFISEFKSDHFLSSAIYRIQNFQAENPFDIESKIKFRPATQEDINKYSSDDSGIHPFSYENMMREDDWICTIDEHIKKSNGEILNSYYKKIENIALSLSLAARGRARFSLIHKSIKSPFLNNGWGYGGNDIYTRRSGSKLYLSSDGIEQFHKIYAEIVRSENSSNYTYLALPLRRLRSASSRTNDEDHLIDCVIGLERLLVPGKGGETSFKFRQRGAALLGDRFGSPKERKMLMRNLYNMRSDIVHGVAIPSRNTKISEQAKISEEALTDIIIWYLNTGHKIGSHKKIIEELDDHLISGGKYLRDMCI